MLKRFVPPLALFFTLLFLVGATTLGNGGIGDGVETAALWIEALGLGLIGAILAVRKPGNPVGWLLLAFGFFYGVNLFGEAFAVFSAVELGRPLV